jgi:hypothetical protein
MAVHRGKKVLNRLRTLRRDRKGTAFVEMAFPTLLFGLIFAGIFEFGRAVHYYQAVNESARTAVRYLARAQQPCDGGTVAESLRIGIARASTWSDNIFLSYWPKDSSWLPSAGTNIAGNPYVFQDEFVRVLYWGCLQGESGPNIGGLMGMRIIFRMGGGPSIVNWLFPNGQMDIAGEHQELYVGL